ncbi:hypothetical protein INR49_015075, partial [Caranx melampygus]
MKNESLVHFFQERQITLNHSLPLETYLLKPVQRILKYHLLLQELSKHFDKSAPGYEVVEDAIITMTAVAWYINDMKRKQEHAVRLQEIESLLVNWSGPDLSGFGELVLEGSFKVHRVKKERAFFLFDKMLLIAKKRLEQFVYSTHIFCCNLLLVETLKDPLCFRVSDQTIPKQQHIVQTRNQEEKRLWVHYLKRLIVENHPASLPQKARQVLGDNFCQSPQFDQDNLKKASASPRLDDIYSYHRGRRQSEPPELLMYTPEKSRKSLPLLLEGNLPYRRTRRQSAPAKDIEAVFHSSEVKFMSNNDICLLSATLFLSFPSHSLLPTCPGNAAALKQAGSEGELCQGDSLGSAGSSSTLASSVIEVDAERSELGLTPQLRRSHEEEEEEEELIPLSPPPTLSITEEILEFINQSRAREGLSSIHANATEQVDQSKESQSTTTQSNFTCPLPPVVCPSSPEQGSAIQQEQVIAEKEDDGTPVGQTSNSDKENEMMTNEVKPIPDATSQVEKGLEAGESQEEGVDKEKEDKKTQEEGEGQSFTLAATSDLRPSASAQEERNNNRREEANTSSLNSDLPHQHIQRRHPPTRGSHLTKRDKKIIEKIRSYYEAAAEAEEDELEEENEQGDGEASRRRNSFSQIPSGLVKESVSRFDVGGHQGETESGQSKHETAEAFNKELDYVVEPCSPTGPISLPVPLSADVDSDRQPDKPIISQDFDSEGPIKTVIPTVMLDEETPNQVGMNLQLNHSRAPTEETEGQDSVCTGHLEEGLEGRQGGDTSVVATAEQGGHSLQAEGPSFTKQHKCRDEPTKTCVRNQGVVNDSEPNQGGLAEPHGSHKVPSTPLTPTDQKTKSTSTGTKHKDLTKTSQEGLPSQIKVGRWSRHSKIVTANRALFEGMGSDVAGIGLFESSPVVDPVVIENSERILSKVQTLARMYSAKASTMKVPLHQKRGGTVRKQSWGSGRLSGQSAHTQNTNEAEVQSQTQNQNLTKHWKQIQHQVEINPSNALMETKSRTQTHVKTKVRSQTLQSLNQTTTWEDQMIQEKMTNRAESLTVEVQRSVMHPCEPVHFGHVFVKEQLTSACHHQTNEFTLSRPRDFISALTKDRDSSVGCRSGDFIQTISPPSGEDPSTVQRDQLSGQAQPNSVDTGCTSTDWRRASTATSGHLSEQPEDQSSSSCCSAMSRPFTPTMTFDCGVTKVNSMSSAGTREALNQTREILTNVEETEKIEWSEQSAGNHVSSGREDLSSANIIDKPAHKYKQAIPEHMDNRDYLTKDDQGAHAEPEDLICTKSMEEVVSPGECVLSVVLTQSQSPTEFHSSMVPQPEGQSHLEEGGSTTQAPSGGPKQQELQGNQMKLHATNCDLNSSSQTKMIVQSSAVIFSEEPPYHRSPKNQPLHLTFDPSQMVITSENPEAGEGAAPCPGLSPNPSQPHSPSVQSGDCLPTFTSQRPPELPTMMGKQVPSNAWNVTSSYEYRETDLGSLNSPPIFSPPSQQHPPSRLSMETASLMEQPSTANATHSQVTEPIPVSSAFRPNLRHRPPSPIKAPPASSPLLPPPSSIQASPCSSPFTVVTTSSPTHSAGMRAAPASSPTPPSVSGRSSSVRTDVPSSSAPSPSRTSSSAFTRSLAASCISQSISQSMSKKGASRQQPSNINTINQGSSSCPSTPSLPSSQLRRSSPSPKLLPTQQSPSTPAYGQSHCIVLEHPPHLDPVLLQPKHTIGLSPPTWQTDPPVHGAMLVDFAVPGQKAATVPLVSVELVEVLLTSMSPVQQVQGVDGLQTSPRRPASAPKSFLSSPSPSDSQTDWEDPELEEGSCRSQLICAYVAHPFQEQNLSSSCLALSSLGTTSPPTNYPFQVKPQPQVQINTRTLPVPPIHSPVPSNSSPLPFLHSSPSKPGNQKTSYATTVNLQIAGSGRITSFSTAQVSLTQTLQGGPGSGGPGPGQM